MLPRILHFHIKRIIIRQFLCPKEKRLLSKNKNIDREQQSLQQDGSWTMEIDRIYISRKRQFTDVSRLSRLFRNTWPFKFHAAICSPSETIFLEDPFQEVEAIRGGHLLFRDGKLVRNKSFAWISQKKFGKKRSVIDDIRLRFFWNWNRRSERVRWMYVLWELMESVRRLCKMVDFEYFFSLFFEAI